jgi:hypothetical protein
MVRAPRESGGLALAVAGPAIGHAFTNLCRHGIRAGHEGAAPLAAVRDARRSNQIAAGARVLIVLTVSHSIALARACSAS